MTTQRDAARPHTGRAGLAASLLVGLSLAGCAGGIDRTVATSAIPTDYRERHPLVLGDGEQRLDVFRISQGDALDLRQKHDVAQFAHDYSRNGGQRLAAFLPHGVGDEAASQRTLVAIRHELSAAGLKGSIAIGGYEVTDPTLAAPVRLTFQALQARTARRCGEWPEDLGSGSSVQTWENKPYYNFGCASQQNLAAQVADPRDLVRPRTEDSSDVQMRTRAIAAVRLGTDPGTSWITHNSSISGVGQ